MNKVEFSCSASVQSHASINFEAPDLFGNEPISPADCDVTTDNPTIHSCNKRLHGTNVTIMCNYSTSYEIHCTFSWNLTNSNESRVYPVACHVNDGTTEVSTRTELIVGDPCEVTYCLRCQLLNSSCCTECQLGYEINDCKCEAVVRLVSSSLLTFVLVLCVCIIIAFLIVMIAWRNRKKELVNLDLRCADRFRIPLDLNSAYQKGHDQKDESHETSTDDTVMKQLLIKYLIPSSQIDIQETIGQGEFGIVYKATIMDKRRQEIALKTLKGAFSKSDVNSLLEECLLMSNFDNPNVLSLIGVCADLGSAPGIIMPYMSKGSLLSYLQKEKSHLIVGETSEESTVLNVRKQLLSVCLQVANGMNYLALQRFIHRDLAARNCLIADNGVIKVADFGLSEEIYTKNYFNQFKKSKSVKLPVKWMALESLHYGIFSEKSDMWSYGILCWEVFSAGKIPYPGIDPIGLVELLDGGQRLSCPHNEICSEDIYSLMRQCWCESPDDRPLFNDLVASVNALIMPLAPYLIVSNDSTFQLNHDHIYY
ncbi:PREDICTED: tyrosine-protein kinase receptor UFO-like [Amphimedon queenslandica]|uniref:Protein kinase domain-containing protein n=2 Tax=Amphimedon queenslandica TaxID=400682 RepID=A0AAN0JTS5_AMPQE|nr:PREDICTED: tyrosine-protein kinase receptor UFO-like [Amphimedon queenslandica]|eukprot:XP_019860447.1 PREDICTED: tyrosine-protein kinase receptor UFO-like [Amphimedon queenslandica]